MGPSLLAAKLAVSFLRLQSLNFETLLLAEMPRSGKATAGSNRIGHDRRSQGLSGQDTVDRSSSAPQILHRAPLTNQQSLTDETPADSILRLQTARPVDGASKPASQAR
jgi:hypothetical protein